MANTRRHDFDQHFASPWAANLDCFDGERFFASHATAARDFMTMFLPFSLS